MRRHFPLKRDAKCLELARNRADCVELRSGLLGINLLKPDCNLKLRFKLSE